MGLRSILDIEVNDSAFQRFSALYGKYQAALKASPAEWKKVTDQVGRTRGEFDQIVKQQIAIQARTKLVEQAQREAERQTRSWGDRMKEVAQWSGQVARNAASIGSSILKWSLIGTTAGGLLGVGSLFGLDRLAGGVAATRRSALGLGTSYGERRAFGANFGRLVDADSFLESVANAKLDVTKRVGLIGGGLSERQIAGRTSDAAVALLRNLKKIADETRPELYAQVIQARQLGQFASPTDLLRLRNTSKEEFGSLLGAFGGNKSTFGLDARTQRAWQEFLTQMTRAGEGIEATFVRGLVPLADPLRKLSAGFERAVSAFLGSDTIKRWMDEAGQGLETLAKYVGTDDFQRGVKEFAEGLGNLATIVTNFVRSFSGGGASPRGATTGGVLGEKEGHDTWNDIVRGSRENRARASGFLTNPIGTPDPKTIERMIRESAARNGIDPDQAVRVAKSEGLYSYVGDKGTSFGPFQLHYKSDVPGMRSSGLGDEFSRYTGLDARNPSTVQQQIDFALSRAREQGWGPWHGWHGDPWAGIDRGSKVTVENNTGGSAVVTTSQVAQ